MRVFTLVVIVFIFSSRMFSQNDDCDPAVFSGNSWLETKRGFFGPNCFQFALNRANSSDFQRYMTLSDGNQVATLDAFQKFGCAASGGCWKSVTRSSYRALSTYHDQSYLPVYTEPLVVQNHGSSIIVTTFTTPIDTTWVEYDDKKILEKINDEYDEYDDMKIALERHREDGKLYYKITATMDLKEHPLEPTAVGQRIVYLANTILYSVIYELSDMEIKEVIRMKGNKQPYYKKASFEALLNISSMAEAPPQAKEGSWSFTREEKTKWYRIENDGETIRMFAFLRSDPKHLEAVAAKMSAWVADHQFKYGKSTTLVKKNKDYWLQTTASLGEKEGEEIAEDYYNAFVYTYCEEFYEEIADIVDDL